MGITTNANITWYDMPLQIPTYVYLDNMKKIV